MVENPDRLYELLPVNHRQRDAEQGWPLKALLRVIAGQVAVVEADIRQLYDNWFIETCEDWVVPYIGDLVGYRLVHEAGQPGDVTTAQGRLRNKILIPRREVANTIHNRRRKGTLYVLELLANQVAGWPARAVEFYRLLEWAQGMNHLRPERGRTGDLRQGDALYRLDTPFDELAHVVDVRRIISRYKAGRHNIPSVGVFVWRLKTYPVTSTPAYCLEDVSPRCFTFSVLGNDSPLYNKETLEEAPTEIAGELNLPVPIRRRAFEKRVGRKKSYANPAYYGKEKSLAIYAPGWHGNKADQPVPAGCIIPADLNGWKYRPPRQRIAVDPELGRIAFHPRDLPKRVWVSYRYGFSDNLGGGEYQRMLSQPDGAKVYKVGKDDGWDFQTIKEALDDWNPPKPAEDYLPPKHAVIEIQDGAVYVEQLDINFACESQTLQIRAANRRRPIIRLLDWQTARPDAMSVAGKPGCRFTLDGFLITGRGVQLEGPLAEAAIQHCTLVPGWSLDSDCAPGRPNEPSLTLLSSGTRVTIDHSIIGSILVNLDEVAYDPIPIYLADSILDATDYDLEAVSAQGRSIAHATLDIQRCTIFGRMLTHAIMRADNSIFEGQVKVARRQTGCIRFCYVTPGSRTPRRYRCQPDLVEEAARANYPQGPERDRAIAQEQLRVQPQFNSVRYGMPTYCQLALTCAEEIRRGADDQSEMGVFHDLFQPQREVNLRARLEEYTPAGMDAGIIFTS